MTTQGNLLRNKAVELIKSNPKGLRYSELMRELHNTFPDIHVKSIPAAVWDLNVTCSKQIYKPTRGLFKYRFSGEEEIEKIVEKIAPTAQEEDFYKPFADWIKDDLGECSAAISLGGSYLGKKWEPQTLLEYISRQPEML